jgi:hypothetical protein
MTLVASVAAAQTPADSTWRVGFSGLLNAFAVSAHWDVGNNKEQTTRIMSGFDPSKFNINITAPRTKRLAVTGHFQFAPSIQSNKAKFAGQSFEVRIAEVDVSGSFGTVEIGRGWSIFNAQAIINDAGSLPGVGRIPSPDRGGPNFGRIGTGYTWTDFDPKVVYSSPSLGGVQFRVGIFEPIETAFGAGSLPSNSGGTGVGALETPVPRVEGEVNYSVKSSAGAVKLWAGALGQPVKDLGTGSSTSITGLDGGAHVDVAGFGLTAAATTTRGTGPSGFQGNGFVCDAAGCRASKTNFWYAGANYTIARNTTFGASTGQGKQAAENGFADVRNTLNVAYLHQRILPELALTLEAHQFQTKTSSVVSEKYKAFIVGTQLNF